MADAIQPIIIKKKKAHHGHHGGAWKVAYADFVTAMMALFIVLWLLSSSEKVKQAVGGYFMDPSGKGKMMGSGLAGAGESLSVGKDDMKQLKEKLEQAVKQMPQLEKIREQIKLTITGEGLRIELLESAKGTFFESGSARPSENCLELLTQMAKELGRLPNTLIIEGHTDAQPYGGPESNYTNWELSGERANSARRVMQSSGVRADQVAQVRGFADQQPLKSDAPLDPSNRRITVIVQYKSKPDAGAAPEAGEKPAGEHGGASHGESAAKPSGEHGESAAKPSGEHGAAQPKPAAQHEAAPAAHAPSH